VESVKGRSEGWNPSEGLPCSATSMGEEIRVEALHIYVFPHRILGKMLCEAGVKAIGGDGDGPSAYLPRSWKQIW